MTHTVNLGIEMRHTENLTKLNMKKRQRLSKKLAKIKIVFVFVIVFNYVRHLL